MKKSIHFVLLLAISAVIWSCGSSKKGSEETGSKPSQDITQSNITGEWQCVDVTNGVAHMESVAKMQPHLVFKENNELFSKMKLPDGSELNQKVGTYKIQGGKVVSDFFEDQPHMQDGKLIIDDKSADMQRIYERVKN